MYRLIILLIFCFSPQHETSSIKMFDYLIDANNLMEEFLKYELDETDVTFIKELIIGPGKDRGPDKVC